MPRHGEEGKGSLRFRTALAALLLFAGAGAAYSELFVADFNGDGKPDVLMSSSTAPDGFVVLLNQGEWGGKVTFQKIMPDVKSPSAGAVPPASAYPPPAQTPAASTMPWQIHSERMESPPRQAPAVNEERPRAVELPPAPKPSVLPPPPPSISSTAPKLKPIGGAAPSVKSEKGSPVPVAPKKEWSAAPAQEPAAARSIPASGRKVALFNYKDKTAGSQFAWLERGISNILKFDVIEIKTVQMIDRERTDVTFDPAWFRDSGLAADIIITGEFQEAADRLIVTTWFISSSMAGLREFKVEGDRADIFSLIEKVGAQLKQELTSL